MSTEINEKEIIFRMAQSLMNEIKSQMAGGMKAGTDVGPYAKRYNFLREKIISLKIKDSETFLPELSEDLFKHGWTQDVWKRVQWFDEMTVAINQMVSFLEIVQKDSFKILTGLEEFLFKNLRKNVKKRPVEEKEIQDVIEIMLNSKGYVFERGKVRIGYSSKEFIPDFTFEDLNAVLEVKFCKTDTKEKDIIDEINADIPAYTTKYNNVTFLVYDLGIIRDIDLFGEDIEKNNPRIKVLVIKQ
jgi:hypothetical protein